MRNAQLPSAKNAVNKASSERSVFQAFLDDLRWPPGAVTSETPPAPDILYKPLNGTSLAFELAEIADKGFVQAMNQFTKLAQTPDGVAPLSRPDKRDGELAIYTDFQNPLQSLLNKKLSKKYQSNHPIHLLLYWAGRSALFQELDMDWLCQMCDSRATGGPFDAIWYWGAEGHPIQVWAKDDCPRLVC